MLREFNLFDVLGISRREIRHSRVLAWLLNPRGTHGLGDLFLRWFLLEVATIAETHGVGDVMTKEVTDWRLEQVSSRAERRNIDVLVLGQGDRFVCAIENKINIGEHSGQLARYMKTVDRQWPGWSALPVFLTPDGKVPEEPDDRARYIPYSHERIASVLDRILIAKGEEVDPDVASLLRQYTYTLRRRVMEATSDVESLAYEIYGKHRGAINRINRALANQEKRAAQVAEQVFAAPLEETTRGLLKHDWHNKIARQLVSPHLDKVSPVEGQMLVFQVKYERAINLYLWICRAKDDDVVRRRLLTLARKSNAPFTVRSRPRKKLNQGWTWIYHKPVISRNDEALLNYDSAKAKVEQAIQDFCETDYFPLVNAIRAEFGLPPVSQP